jgi:hypothetical protein
VVVDPEYCVWPYVKGEYKTFDFPANSQVAAQLTEQEIEELLVYADTLRNPS